MGERNEVRQFSLRKCLGLDLKEKKDVAVTETERDVRVHKVTQPKTSGRVTLLGSTHRELQQNVFH